MAIISQLKEGENEVLFHLFEDGTCTPGQRSTLLFHKRMHGSIDLPDHRSAAMRISASMNEIHDLIY
jgi:hypothetical protein